MSGTIRALAHAKINLVLRVLAREATGYHSIETLFQLLDLADVVDVEVRDDTRTISCIGPALPGQGLGPPEQNLAMRAALAYAEISRWPTGWHIDIEKHIPVGGGLGGGSANAAAVLRALEALSPYPIGHAALMELAGTLGADVPFLLSGAPLAWAWGRGDRLLPLPGLATMGVTLLSFDEGVSTAAAYQTLADQRSGNPRKSAAPALTYPVEAFSTWSSIVALAGNDFEDVVPAVHGGVARWLPVVQQAAARFRANGSPAIGQMSGSGATCFLLCVKEQMPEFPGVPGMRTERTQTVSEIGVV